MTNDKEVAFIVC